MRSPSRLAASSAAVLAIVLAAVLAPAPAAHAAAPDTTITSGPENGAVLLPGPVSYTFTSDAPGATFQCSVDNAPFTACTSPATYNLPPLGHVFLVRAVVGMSVDPTPAQRIWNIRNIPCEQAGEAYQVAQAKYFDLQPKLAKAKKQLHRAHNHGSAAAFQRAKNKLRKIKTKVAHAKDQMNAAIAQENAVC